MTDDGSGGGAVDDAVGRWHAALAYALLGPPVRPLTEPGTPRVAALIVELGGVETVRARVSEARAAGPWPFPVPDDLRRGLGPAQLAAAWRATLVELGPLTTNARPVVTDRALTADDRRLLADRPPHHGS
ncbi:hypothetical protein GCM10022204_32400 [Microlunatus aurantiacus]|uniref:Uncharacterized protein n=1 Tax=Microlunatus aurantiacus TaxID=446786 RepID=A0ABP7DZ95_9ACTN